VCISAGFYLNAPFANEISNKSSTIIIICQVVRWEFVDGTRLIATSHWTQVSLELET
jgi:hypothetical protein